MKGLKVLVLSNMYPGKKSKTFGIFVKNQVEALREKGINVEVAAINNPDMGKKNVIQKYSSWLFRSLTKLLNGKKYDVVHAHYIFPTGLIGLAFKKLFGTRFIVTSHGGDIDKMAKKSPVIKKWTTRILQEADHVIAVGDKLYEEIHREFNVPAEKLSLINMGVNRKVFKPMDRVAIRNELGIMPEEQVLLYVGNIIEAKGIMELLDAFSTLKKEHPQATLRLFGNAKVPGFHSKVNERIKELNTNDIILKPAISQKEVAIWMNAADVFVLPSYIEGFGLVALEAMACKTPVVGSDVGGLTNLLADNHGILIEPKNAESLYLGIKEVLDSAELANMLIENGMEKAELFDQDKQVKKVISIYAPMEEENQ